MLPHRLSKAGPYQFGTTFLGMLERLVGVEPTTPDLARRGSASELQAHGAHSPDRTDDLLFTKQLLYQLSYACVKSGSGSDLEARGMHPKSQRFLVPGYCTTVPTKQPTYGTVLPTGVPAEVHTAHLPLRADKMEHPVGIEPTASGLEDRRSTSELRMQTYAWWLIGFLPPEWKDSLSRTKRTKEATCTERQPRCQTLRPREPGLTHLSLLPSHAPHDSVHVCGFRRQPGEPSGPSHATEDDPGCPRGLVPALRPGSTK